MNFKAYNYLPVWILVIDRKREKIIYTNRELDYDYFEPNKAGDNLWTDFFDNDEAERIKQDVDSQLSQGNNFVTEFLVKGDAKKKVWTLAKGNVLEFDENQYLFVCISDITHLKNAEESLLEKTGALELINDSVSGGIVIMNFDDHVTIVYANKGYYKLIGYTKEEMEENFQHKASAVVHPEDLGPTMENFKKAMQTGSKYNMELRLCKKNGDIIWVTMDGVIDKENNKIFCIILDNTKAVNIMQELKKEQEYSRILLELTDDILFDYDLTEDTITFSGNSTERLKIPKKLKNFPTSAFEMNYVLEEDKENFINICDGIKKGISQTLELRFTRENRLVWYTVNYKLLYKDELPIKAIGKMTDITTQKFKIKELEARAETDPLTKLFNKQETQDRIKKCLISSKPGEKFAMMIVDIDNFKRVNDTLGHHFGDAVLIDIAGKLKGLFGSENVVGRIGGDEFIVFFKNITSEETVIEKAQLLTDVFRRTYSGENMDYKISGSIGIAYYPDHGESFEGLYLNSDIALYESKRRGKDCYTIYNPNITKCVMSNEIPLMEARRFISEYYRDDLIYNIFEMLYETKDLYTTVNMILAVMGEKFKVDRCYIFERTPDGKMYNNTYEWCAPNVRPEKDNLQNVPQEDLDRVLIHYNEEGIFYCNDIASLDEYTRATLESQGIKSLLHTAVFQNREIWGFVGFDECKTRRIWGGEEIATLTYVAKILSIFVTNKRMSRELWDSYQNCIEMLDSISGYVYVIDTNTGETLYINKAVKNLGAVLGDRCYEIAFGKGAERCSFCPTFLLSEFNTHVTVEVPNSRFAPWISTTASLIKWTGNKKDAALICCNDITKYKTGKNLYEI